MSVLEELHHSLADAYWGDDCASGHMWNCFFGARSFHGLAEDDWPDVYSYAMEAAEALGL